MISTVTTLVHEGTVTTLAIASAAGALNGHYRGLENIVSLASTNGSNFNLWSVNCYKNTSQCMHVAELRSLISHKDGKSQQAGTMPSFCDCRVTLLLPV